MPNINDVKYAAVNTQNRNIQDEYYDWLGSKGASGDTVQDRERSFLEQQGVSTPGQINDGWFEYLRGQGFLGSLMDMLFQYWDAGGTTDPTGVPVVTQSVVGPTDPLVINISFTKQVAVTDATGLSVSNNTITNVVASGNTLVITVQDAIPSGDDTVTWTKTAASDLANPNGDAPVANGTYPVTNTLDFSEFSSEFNYEFN